MDVDPAAALDVDVDAADLMEHFDRDSFRGREYYHLTDARHGIERGTAIFDDAVVRGFPSIPRALVLDPGIPENFEGPVHVEEKLNGYNVRLARVDGDLLALTRGGWICPYTTDLARERLGGPDGPATSLLAAHPDRMLCLEVVGPENPYTSFDYPSADSIAFRTFDVRDAASGAPMEPDRRRTVCDRHGVPQVPHLGTYDLARAPAEVRADIEALDSEGREGVVMQSADGRDRLKYTTSAIHTADLEHAFALPFDYGRDFLFARLIREAFQAVEFGDSEAEARERAHAVGEALLLPAIETIRDVQAGETVGESHTVRGDPATVQALLDRFGDLGITVEVEADRTVEGERVVTFTKVAASTRDSIEHYLAGGTIDE